MDRVILFCVLALAVTVFAKKCDDIDTSACQLMVASRPDLCSDPSLSQTACPRFCKLCPIECYHCNDTVMDFHDCNTTMLCGEGEVCMRKELLSYSDGHHEYEMTCARQELCDGTGVSFPFGKREVAARDLSLTCCTDDFCNYPGMTTTPQPTTTTTTTMSSLSSCKRDVIIVVDESTHMRQHESAVNNFLRNLAANLQIGPNASLVSMATYTSTTKLRWDLDAHPSNNDLDQAIQNIIFNWGSGGDNAAALSYLTTYAATSRAGDRPDASDVVIFITADHTSSTFQATLMENRLDHTVDDVIVIGLGRVDGSDLSHLTSDKSHVFKIFSDYQLTTALGKIYDLICPPSTYTK